MESTRLTLKNGLVLKGLKWVVAAPSFNVVIVEGMEEHTSRYDDFAHYLNDNHINVYALDAFGQGENVKDDLSNRGVWPKDGFALQVEGVHDLVEKLKNETKLPTYIFSHSMGSFMGQEYIQRYPGHVEKIVLCGSGCKNPAIGPGYLIAKMCNTKKKTHKPAKLLAKLMFGSFNKKIKKPRTPFDWLSYNEENVDRYIADPLCGYGPNNGFCFEFIKGMKNLHHKKRLRGIDKKQKIFLISGDGDPVTNYGKAVKKNMKMYESLGIKTIKERIYRHMRHEILNEKDRIKVYKDILDFFVY